MKDTMEGAVMDRKTKNDLLQKDIDPRHYAFLEECMVQKQLFLGQISVADYLNKKKFRSEAV